MTLSKANPLFSRTDFLTQVALGQIEGYELIYKFGRNKAVGTSLEPITISGIYRTPTVGVKLEVVSSSTSDTANGIGARGVKIEGIGTDYTRISETVATNGTSASTATTQSFLRVFRARVSTSGTYATQSGPSQVGAITIRQSGGGSTWALMDTAQTGFGVGQSQIGQYTVPKGYTAVLLNELITVETNRTANVFLFRRDNINDIIASYEPMRLVQELDGLTNAVAYTPIAPISVFQEYTDFGFMGLATQESSVSVDFGFLLINNNVLN